MTKAKSKVIDFIKKHILLFLLVAGTIIAIFLRICGMDFQSDDFNSFLNSWWSIIKLNDFTGLATQVGNYNIPYQVIIYLMTLLPLNALYAYKILSIISCFCTKTSRLPRLCSSALRLHSSCKPYSSFLFCFITGFRQRKFRFCISL